MVILDERSWAARTLDALEEGPRTPLARALIPLGGVYAGAARWIRRIRPDRPIAFPPATLGIGNVRVGGTGKTPVTADFARRLRERGFSVAVVTRGYRAEGGGDEPAWIRDRTGVKIVIDRHRRRGVERARRDGADFVLLDDALQSPDRPRACVALLLQGDLERPPRTLPAGPAREDAAAALARADAVAVRLEGDTVLAGWCEREHARWARCLGSHRPVLAFRLVPQFLSDGAGERRPLADARGLGRSLLVSGLARPSSFEADCERLGIQAVASLRWDDHCSLGEVEHGRIAAVVSRNSIDTLVCPEKNRQRLLQLGLDRPLWSVVSEIEWDPADPLRALAGLLPSVAPPP